MTEETTIEATSEVIETTVAQQAQPEAPVVDTASLQAAVEASNARIAELEAKLAKTSKPAAKEPAVNAAALAELLVFKERTERLEAEAAAAKAAAEKAALDAKKEEEFVKSFGDHRFVDEKAKQVAVRLFRDDVNAFEFSSTTGNLVNAATGQSIVDYVTSEFVTGKTFLFDRAALSGPGVGDAKSGATQARSEKPYNQSSVADRIAYKNKHGIGPYNAWMKASQR